jgi:hypothetical protein
MLTCYSAYVRNDSFYVYFFGVRFFYFGMEDTRSVAEILAEMGSEEYEAARILTSMKCPGNTGRRSPPGDTGASGQSLTGRGVPWRVPIMMLSLWAAAPMLSVSTPYILWHGKWERMRIHLN